MLTRARIWATAAGTAAVLTLTGITWVAAGTAEATTGTCLGTQNPVSGSVSCGGLFLPGMNPAAGVQPDSGSLTLTAAADYWDAPITFSPYNPSLATQDFTVYERCAYSPAVPGGITAATVFNAGSRTEANPCGSVGPSVGSPVLNAASGRSEFVAEVTPLGKHLGAGLNDIGNLCISWEAQRIGPNHKFRFAMVERTCDTYGAFFIAPIDDGVAANPPYSNTGVPGIVVNGVNPFQTFAAIPANGGDLIANDALSGNFFNHPFVVDDKAQAYPGGQAILYPENNGKNQIASFIGCNGAVITTGVTYACP